MGLYITPLVVPPVDSGTAFFGRCCFVPFERGLAGEGGGRVVVDGREARRSPCGGLSEPSGPSPSAWADASVFAVVSAAVMAMVRGIVNAGVSGMSCVGMCDARASDG